MAELAARHPGTVPSDLDELARYFIFEDFPHFIRNYLAVVDLIKTAEDVRLITYEVAADMAAQHIRYAELTVTPYISISDNLPAEAFLEAIEDARQAARDHRVDVRTPAPTRPAKAPRAASPVPSTPKPARQRTAQPSKPPRKVLY